MRSNSEIGVRSLLYQEDKSVDSNYSVLEIPAFNNSDCSIKESPSNAQVTKDQGLALSLHASLDQDNIDDDSELDDGMEMSKKGVTELHNASQVVQELHEKVLQTELIFLTFNNKTRNTP